MLAALAVVIGEVTTYQHPARQIETRTVTTQSSPVVFIDLMEDPEEVSQPVRPASPSSSAAPGLMVTPPSSPPLPPPPQPSLLPPPPPLESAPISLSPDPVQPEPLALANEGPEQSTASEPASPVTLHPLPSTPPALESESDTSELSPSTPLPHKLPWEQPAWV